MSGEMLRPMLKQFATKNNKTSRETTKKRVLPSNVIYLAVGRARGWRL